MPDIWSAREPRNLATLRLLVVLSHMDIVFFGSGAFGIPTLEALARAHRICAIITQPDKPAGRGAALTPTPIALFAAQHLPAVPLLKPVKVSDPAVIEQIRSFGTPSTSQVSGAPAGGQELATALPSGSLSTGLGVGPNAWPGAWVVIAFGQKLPQGLLADRFAVNLHASLLPRWRGAAPIHAAIIAGDTVTGNSIITLADRMDAGLVLGQSRREVIPTITSGELHDQLAADGPELMLRVLDQHAQGNISAVAQAESDVTLAGKFTKADGYVDFTSPAGVCKSRINGLTPWPGVTMLFRDAPLKLLRANISQGAGEPGTLLDGASGIVACGGATAVTLLEVQPAGGKAMQWADFARGRTPKSGERFEMPAGRAK
jgi:methionyl-tRNA formyltransferase